MTRVTKAHLSKIVIFKPKDRVVNFFAKNYSLPHNLTMISFLPSQYSKSSFWVPYSGTVERAVSSNKKGHLPPLPAIHLLTVPAVTLIPPLEMTADKTAGEREGSPTPTPKKVVWMFRTSEPPTKMLILETRREFWTITS